MQIIVKTDAILKHQIQKEVAKPAALNQMKERYESEKFKANDKWWRSRTDYVESAKNAKMLEKNLAKVMPEQLSAEAKDIMWRRAKQLKDEFTIGMLSREELHPVKGFSENGGMKWVVDEEKMRSLNSVERNIAWNNKNESKVREFKSLMRHLCPQDPNAGDIEKFRPKMRGVI